MEADLSAEQQRLENRLGKHLAKKEDKALADLEAQKAALLNDGSLSDDDRARQLAALQAQEAAVRQRLSGDREAAKAKLKERLAARRGQAMSGAILSGDAAMRASLEDAKSRPVRVEVTAATDDEEEGTEGKEERRYIGQSSEEEEGGKEEEEDEEVAENRRRQRWLDGILEGSPMLRTLGEIEGLVRSLEGLPPRSQPGPGEAPEAGDARFKLEGRLAPSDLASLSPAQLTTLEFGRLLVRLLSAEAGGPRVELRLADALPRNNYEGNAFRRSVFFSNEDEVLFVRRKRAENIGDFMIVILHSLAHIAADDLKDDANPLQQKFFYRFLRCVCRHFLCSPQLGHNLAGDARSPDAISAALSERAALLRAGEPSRTPAALRASAQRIRAHQASERFLEAGLGLEHKSIGGRLVGLKGRNEGASFSASPTQVDTEMEAARVSRSLQEILDEEQDLVERLEAGPSAEEKAELEASIDALQSRKKELVDMETALCG